MVVFLNKCDLLKRKLKSGVMVNKYLPSYGNRPNDLQTVVKCESKKRVESPTSSLFSLLPTDLREKFKDTSKQFSPEPRTCYLFATSVTVRRRPHVAHDA